MLTALEAAKSGQGTVFDRAVIQIFAMLSPILRVLPIRTINGNAHKYNQEEALPGVAFRGVNESYTESTGIINPQTESLSIMGGDLDVDKFIVDTEGEDQRSIHELMKFKAIVQDFQTSFFKGDVASNPKDIEGLQKRITGDQLIDAGSTSGGDALSLSKLDELMDAVEEPTHLLMNKAMRRRLTAAARTTSVGGYITYSKDEFGRTVTQYNEIPILVIESLLGKDTVLPFTEASPGGGAAASTSIYCVSMGPGKLQGIQFAPINARDLGELQTAPKYRTRVEWYCGMELQHGRAAGRLQGIKDAAAVA